MSSALRPNKGIAVTIGGVEFHFLFTFAVLDDLQTYYKEPISDIIKKLTDEMTIYSAAGRIIEALIASDIYNNAGPDATRPTYQEIMHVLDLNDSKRIIAVLLGAYGLDMPEPDEDDDDENDEAEQINIARLLIIGKTELGMSEEEFWRTTPRKYFMLFDEYIKLKGGGKDDGGGIDDLP